MNRKARRQARRTGRAGPSPAAGQALAAASRHHQAGRLHEARSLYEQVLAAEPGNPDACHLLGVLSHQTGDTTTAVALIGRAIRARPGDPDFHFHLGEVERARGRASAAIRAYRRALELDPSNPDAYFGLGNAFLNAGDAAAAAEAYRRAIALAPGDAEAHNNLGNALSRTGDAADAEASYRAAIAARPEYAEAHVNLGELLLDRGDIAAARDTFVKATELDPGLAAAHVGLGLALEAENRDAAAGSFLRALELEPDSGRAHHALGRLLWRAKRPWVAEPHLRRVTELRPEDASAWNDLGAVLMDLDRLDDAVSALRRATALDPALAEAATNLGACLQFKGRFEESRRWLRRALDLDPDETRAFYYLVMARQIGEQEDISRFEALAESEALPDERLSMLLFGLGQMSESRGDYDRAFADFRAANAIRDREFGAGMEARRTEQFESIERVFDADFFSRHAGFGSESELPVFIVGMPRSGTSLVEQILASHPDVHGAGELSDIGRLTTKASEAAQEPYPVAAAKLDRESVAALADDYLGVLRGLASDAARVTDKHPLNFFQLGFIRLLFPRARILHCTRDAMDVCTSCYTNSFYTMDFSYDLGRLGRFYRRYERLMAHWRAVLPAGFLDIDYAELVTDTEAVSRRMIAHLGLDWSDRCLEFHRTERDIHTVSVWQARQPIYRSSLHRWRRYEKHLGPLRAALGRDQPDTVEASS